MQVGLSPHALDPTKQAPVERFLHRMQVLHNARQCLAGSGHAVRWWCRALRRLLCNRQGTAWANAYRVYASRRGLGILVMHRTHGTTASELSK